jgi:EAL domain-containing protein (putative c-di-GMP-specific phosphodiesterase class I)
MSHAHSRDASVLAQPAPRILLVDDEPEILKGFSRVLRNAGYEVETASDGEAAIKLLDQKPYESIISDIAMPGMTGVELLRAVRARDLDVPVILITGSPTLRSAIEAVQYGALRYLEKPFSNDVLIGTVAQAVRMHGIAAIQRQAVEMVGGYGMQVGDLATLETRFESALRSIHLVYQPIVQWSNRKIHAYEALMRCDEVTLPRPPDVLSAAERLHRLNSLGRVIRQAATGGLLASDTVPIFVNLHSQDLLDEDLFSAEAPLTAFSSRVVLEVTERATLDEVPEVRQRIARLRKLGYRIALDDLGSGYAGLSSFAQLEPEYVKIDMTLIRNVHLEPTKQKLLQSLISLCRDMGIKVVAEGIETVEERNVLVDLGCDLLQGYLFAKPGKPFPLVTW